MYNLLIPTNGLRIPFPSSSLHGLSTHESFTASIICVCFSRYYREFHTAGPVSKLWWIPAVVLRPAGSTKYNFVRGFSNTDFPNVILSPLLERWKINFATTNTFLLLRIIHFAFSISTQTSSMHVAEVNADALCGTVDSWCVLLHREGKLKRCGLLGCEIGVNYCYQVMWFTRTEYDLTNFWFLGLTLSKHSTTESWSWYLDCWTIEDRNNMFVPTRMQRATNWDHAMLQKSQSVYCKTDRQMLLPDNKLSDL
jgi:hypothetical protein